MNKTERVQNAFEGKPVDKVPVSMWFHFQRDDRYGDEFVKTHLNYYRATNIDFLKLMNDAFFPFPIDVKINKASDWRSLKPKGKNSKYIREQAEYAARINDVLQGDCMTFWSIFAPFSSMRFTVGDPMVTEQLKEDPQSVIEGMKAVAQDCADISELCTTAGGCSGTYIALHSADVGRYTEEQYRSWIMPQELKVLEMANATSRYNIAHLCGWSGIKNNLNWWKDYPAQLMHWAANVDDVTWEQGKAYFGKKTRMGGFDSRAAGLLYNGTEAEIKAETKRLISVSGTQGVILGADCTVPSDIDYNRIKWVVEAAAEAGEEEKHE